MERETPRDARGEQGMELRLRGRDREEVAARQHAYRTGFRSSSDFATCKLHSVIAFNLQEPKMSKRRPLN